MLSYKRKWLFLALLIGFGVGNTEAKPVSEQAAARVASAFWNNHRDHDVKHVDGLMKIVETEYDAFFVFTNGDAAGFVIVAADDCVLPILAYSFHEYFNLSENKNVQYWLSGYQVQIDFCRRKNLCPSKKVILEWYRLSSDSTIITPTSLTNISPLLSTVWDQSPYYNDMCPYNSQYGQRTVTGCVATAMAQVMRYWEHPTTGQGSHQYWSARYGMLSADFGNTTYDWQNMPNAINASSTAVQKNAVATLMYHCGVAIEMRYGVASEGGSGAYLIDYSDYGYSPEPCTQLALVDYFGYSDSIQSKVRLFYSDDQWKLFIKTELDANRPVLYAGSDDEGGHCFVCDGYNSSETHFHFNWGWGGYCDGYYTLANLAPGTGGTGGNATYTFNQNQEILIGVKPMGGTTDTEIDCDAIIGDTLSRTESVNIPVNNRYKYSLTEIIILQNELCDSTNIREIRVYYNAPQPSMGKDSVTIWIQPTAKEFFSSESDLELIDSAVAVQVYNGSFNCSEGWNVFPFDVDYLYNGHCNLMIIIDDNSNSFNGSNNKFRTADAGNYKTLAWFDNNQNPNPNDRVYSGNKYRYQFRPLIILSSHRTIRHTITVTTDNPAHGMVEGGGRYLYGTVATLTAIANDGYHFVRWQDGVASNPRQVVVTADASYMAIFAADIVTYTVSANSSDPSMGTVLGVGQYPLGSIASITAIPYTGYCFDHWNDGSTSVTKTFRVTGNVNFTATFRCRAIFSVMVEANDTVGGSVFGGGQFYEGDIITITANASEGYHFVQWQDGNTESIRAVTVREDKIYTAYFALDTTYYTITVLSNDTTMGSTIGSGHYPSGDTAFIEAVAQMGFRFTHWQDDCEDSRRIVIAACDTIFIAYFEPEHEIFYTITASEDNPQMGIVFGSGVYEYQEIAVVRAVPFEGYDFSHWQDGETVNPRQIIVTSDSSFIAYFHSTQGVEQESKVEISIFPNPTSGMVSVKPLDVIEKILVMTDSGIIVGSFADIESVDLSKFGRGVYFLHVITRYHSSTHKIICN